MWGISFGGAAGLRLVFHADYFLQRPLELLHQKNLHGQYSTLAIENERISRLESQHSYSELENHVDVRGGSATHRYCWMVQKSRKHVEIHETNTWKDGKFPVSSGSPDVWTINDHSSQDGNPQFCCAKMTSILKMFDPKMKFQKSMVHAWGCLSQNNPFKICLFAWNLSWRNKSPSHHPPKQPFESHNESSNSVISHSRPWWPLGGNKWTLFRCFTTLSNC